MSVILFDVLLATTGAIGVVVFGALTTAIVAVDVTLPSQLAAVITTLSVWPMSA